VPRIPRLLPLLAASLAVLALSACGGAGTGSSGKSDEEKRLAFEDCLRDRGLDVQTSADGRTAIRMSVRAGGPGAGTRKFGTGGPGDPNGPFAVCRRQTGWAPSPPTAAQRAEMRDRALRIARCMREHGVDMADPAPDGRQLIRIDGSSPTFRAAARACGLDVPGGGPVPARPGRGDAGFAVAP